MRNVTKKPNDDFAVSPTTWPAFRRLPLAEKKDVREKIDSTH